MEKKDLRGEIHFSPVSGMVEIKVLQPLIVEWAPRVDITTWELAMCIPHLVNRHPIMPGQIDTNEPYTRHFKIKNPNE